MRFSQQPASPPSGYNSNSAYPERLKMIKQPNLFSRLLLLPQQHQQQDHSIELTIEWATQDESHLKQWSHLFELADRLSKSEPDGKLAIKSLKKLIRSNSNHSVQIRAIRLTVILVLNSSDRFRLLVVKKLLYVLEEVYHKSTKHDKLLPVKEILFSAFSVLGHEFQHDEDLRGFTNFYNKIKPIEAPLNGTALNETDGIFTPIVTPVPTSQESIQAQQPIYTSHPLNGPTIPALRDVRAEAEVARSNARLLIEALAFTPPSEMESNEIIQEFHAKCLQSQNQLMDDIPWATEQATQARQYQNQLEKDQSEEVGVGRVNPYSSTHTSTNSEEEDEGGNTKQEELLSLLLAVNNELVDGFKQYDELESLARNEREIRLVEERSKIETRYDRTSHSFLDPNDHHHHHHRSQRTDASGSSSNASPRPSIDRDSTGHSPSHHHHSPSPNHTPTLLPQVKGYSIDDNEDTPPIMTPNHHSTPIDPEFYISSSSSTTNIHKPNTPISDTHFHHHQQQKDMNGEVIVNPIKPSQKALGKMRRFSTRMNSVDHSESNSMGYDSNILDLAINSHHHHQQQQHSQQHYQQHI
ncbi:hypothetical protein Pst134EA_017174 [Puccinia striiformis f. sp. tritici]|uniref:hypothetical protein n=1 Tax=Puccinia striiformis f. sp. tritici TaxID=168172 RepID=UPI002008133D|nr:hypothetical protein Pst134EA_017174 [Puccinia striiformis f. sp. tritici]KAH9460861.1 hypothetical protein Pst134EA_017174 [Puccinia striiformis f. sp. tritici]